MAHGDDGFFGTDYFFRPVFSHYSPSIFMMSFLADGNKYAGFDDPQPACCLF
jgi:hypothetical protein